jgi:large subunit ribosomal protein L10
MARPDKVQTVAELGERFSQASATVLTEYRGLSVKDLKQLRRSLGEDASYTIAKNTLTQLAAHQAGIDGLDQYLTGPTAIAFIDGDIAKVAKGLRDFAREHPALVLKGGLMDGNVLDAQAVKKLADLESREVLLSKMAAVLQAGATQLVRLLAAPLAQAARALDALRAVAEDNPALLPWPATASGEAEPGAATVAEGAATEAVSDTAAEAAAADAATTAAQAVDEEAAEAKPEAETPVEPEAETANEADAAAIAAQAVDEEAAEATPEVVATAVEPEAETASEADPVSTTAAEAVDEAETAATTTAEPVDDTAAQAVTEEAAEAATEADPATTTAAQAATEEKE